MSQKREGLLTADWTVFDGPVEIEIVNSGMTPAIIYHRVAGKVSQTTFKAFTIGTLAARTERIEMRSPSRQVAYYIKKSEAAL